MAQHYRIKKKDEPALFKSAQKVVTLARIHKSIFGLGDFESVEYNRKTIQRLSREYCTTVGSTVAFSINPFKLKGKQWKDEGPDLRDRASIECHVNLLGNILSIFVVA